MDHLNTDQVTWDGAKRAVIMSPWDEKEYVRSVQTCIHCDKKIASTICCIICFLESELQPVCLVCRLIICLQ